MEVKRMSEYNVGDAPFTALLYCPPGVGKSTAIGLIAEQSEGNTLVLDVDRTIKRTLAKGEVVKSLDKIIVAEVENRAKNEKRNIDGTFESWRKLLREEITPQFIKDNNITTIAVDNISELERCILSDLGAQGKNKGVPAQADYQYMQFQLVNSLRLMKNWGVNIVWTAWEDVRSIIAFDGTTYSQSIPKMSLKIVDNICGLCDIVGRIMVNKEGVRGIVLEATQGIYAKNQVDSRKGCRVDHFIKGDDDNEKAKEEHSEEQND